MRLERITLYRIEMDLVAPFETSFGVETRRPAILVEARSGGASGWGECVAGSGPWYAPETVETAWHILEAFLVPLLRDADWAHPTELPERFKRVRGHPMAKAALEAACWDLWCRLQGVSLKEALGGAKDEVESGVSLGIQPAVERLLEAVEEHHAQGYRRVKLKIKPGWDLEVVRRVRDSFPELPLQVDANAAYTPADRTLFQELDGLDLMMIEQPLGPDDLVDHAALQAELKTPICLDESLKTPDDVRTMLALGSGRIVNIKAGRVGGLSAAKRIHDLCRQKGVPVWCGGMLETGVGRAANVALASLPGFVLPNDLSASARYYRQDLIEPPFVLSERGTLAVPQGPGIGVEVLQDRLAEVTTRMKTFDLH